MLDVSFTALLFFATGYFIKKSGLISQIGAWFIFMLFVLWAIGYGVTYFKNGFVWELVLNQNGDCFFAICTAVCGTFIVMWLSLLFEQREMIATSLLKGIGFYSVLIYPLSKFVPDTLKILFKTFGFNNRFGKIYIAILSIIIIYLVVYMKRIFERRTV